MLWRLSSVEASTWFPFENPMGTPQCPGFNFAIRELNGEPGFQVSCKRAQRHVAHF